MDQKKIGNFIAKCRKEKGMTQQELADKLYVTDRAISNWENGRRMPDVAYYKLLCQYLDISVDELLNGRRIIKKEEIINSSNETIINITATSKKRKMKTDTIISILITCFILLVLMIFIIYKKNYYKLDIYSLILDAQVPDDGFKVKKVFTSRYNNKDIDVYFYGIDNVKLCDSKEKCENLETLLNKNKTSFKEIEAYLLKEHELDNNNVYGMYDGGTTIYENSRYSVMYCNTMEGNNDIYIGLSDMENDLKGNYCGHSEKPQKEFIRTYYVLSASLDENDSDFLKVKLRDKDGHVYNTKVYNSSNIVVGQNHYFTFITYAAFTDTMENIFKNSTILSIKKLEEYDEVINEPIIINKSEEFNMKMEIKKGTLSNTGATIVVTNLTGMDYYLGDSYTIERYENGKWESLTPCANCGFNSPAYSFDNNHKYMTEINWEWIYGKLKPGKYRLTKEAFLIPNLNKEKNIPLSIEFIINN